MVPVKQCTHVVYLYVFPAIGGHIQYINDALSQLVALKSQNQNLKVLAAIGSYYVRSEFSEIVRDAEQRATFVQTLVDLVNQYNLDGIDIDWEDPGQMDGANDDFINYTTFLNDLREKLTWNKLITAAVQARTSLIGSSYNVTKMSDLLNFINLLTFNFHGVYDGRTGQNAPLYASNADSDKTLNSDAAVQALISAGATPSKILLDLSFYGYSFKLANYKIHGLGAPTIEAGFAGPYTNEMGLMSYLEICQFLKQGGWTTVYDKQQQSVYSYKDTWWIGYDNVQSIKAKANYAIDKGLGGVMISTLDFDDAKNSCGGGSMPLLTAVNSVITH